MINCSFLYFQILRKVLKKRSINNTVYGNKIYSIEDGERLIHDIVQLGKPCMIGRIGSTEMQTINAVTSVECGLRKELDSIYVDTVYNNAGFFPKSNDAISDFVELYRKSCTNVDVAALLMNRDEDYFFHRYGNKIEYVVLNALEPYYSSNPWTSALHGKRVLIIHPFTKTIISQYNKRTKLFENQNILPEFDLLTIKAVQSIGDNTQGFKSWFEALEYMKKEIDNTDFDIAILGCGAYAFPLASYIKQRSKQAVVMGGATQLLFGIKGKRWDQHRFISHLYNDYWVRPLEEETPIGSSEIENGCYW